MYGLPQAGILAQELLTKQLLKAGYMQSAATPGFWPHKWQPISFALVIDTFGIKYINKTDAKHLLAVLKLDYECDTDYESTGYLSLTIDWDYKNHKVYLSMPGHINKALVRFNHTPPDKPQHQPHPHMVPTYGATIQYAKHINQSPAATKADQQYIRQVVRVLLYYTRAVGATLLVALSSLTSLQAAPTEYTMHLVKWLLNYVATQPNAVLTYEKNGMILAIHSDASYLSKATARSQAGGHFFCSKDSENPCNNGAVHNVSKILKAVMSSAAEAELCALYINACKAVPMRQLPEEMGHKQPKTPIKTDNSTAFGVINNNINNDVQRPWTCVSTGYAVANHKTNSGTIADLEPRTELTTGPSIIAQLTTLTSARKFSLQNSNLVLSKQQMLPPLRDPTSTANQRY
jgi:hypothetical protein